MFKNRRCILPKGLIVFAFFCFCIFLCLHSSHKGERWKVQDRKDTAGITGESLEYQMSISLPITYAFTAVPKLTDIPEADYERTKNGIAAEIAESLYLYVGEYRIEEETGISVIMNELPYLITRQYYRDGSYIDSGEIPEEYQSMAGTDYTYRFFIITELGGTKMKYSMVSFETADEQEKVGICMAAAAPDGRRDALDYGIMILKEIAEGIRDKEEPGEEEESYFITGSNAEDGYLLITEPDITTIAMEEDMPEDLHDPEALISSLGGTGADQGLDHAMGPETGESLVKESKAVQTEGNGQVESRPQKEPVEEAVREASVSAESDLSTKTFEAPLIGYPMTIVVTIGSNSPDSIVSVTCPDGSVLTSFFTEKSASFYTTSQMGIYTVTVTHFTAAHTVDIDIHLE